MGTVGATSKVQVLSVEEPSLDLDARCVGRCSRRPGET